MLVTLRLSKQSGDLGTITVYTYAQAVYLLPYAVLAVPVATSAFPALAARTGAGEDVTRTLQRTLRAVLVLTGLSVGVLIAAAPAVGAFFSLLDAQPRRRRHEQRRPGSAAGHPHRLRARAWSGSA